MTSDTAIRIWTPLNTAITLRLFPNTTVADVLKHALATNTGLVSLILGNIEEEYGWHLYVNRHLAGDVRYGDDEDCKSTPCNLPRDYINDVGNFKR